MRIVMDTTIGFLLIFGIIGGGIYLYMKVVQLDREIARQQRVANGDSEDDSS
jgi:hypothetical protein